ncbi:MAG: hypothetical protein Fur0020_06710 [Thermodesulfovibrionia bacterium]
MILPENRKRFIELLQKWIVLEGNTIDSANRLLSMTSNPFVKGIIELIRIDSEKHRLILETIRLSLDSTVTFTHEDMEVVNTFIERHDSMEKGTIDIAEQIIGMVTLPIPRLLMTHLLEDEKSHDRYIEELTRLKLDMAKATQ